MARGLLLLFVLLLAANEVNGRKRKCPRNCRCEDRNLVYVSCAWLGYTTVPEDIPYDVEHLSLYSNDIKVLRASDLRNFTKLEVLSLERNGIEEIEEGSFANLNHLKSLSLSGNRLRRLPSQLFFNLSSLTELHLEFNELVDLSQDLFLRMSHLEELYLNGNHLSKITSGSLVGLSNLKKLGLSFNRIEKIQDFTFSGVGRLTWLYINGNNISSIGAKAFYDLPRLTRLHLDNNNLRELSATVIRKSTKLTLLTLHKNKFLCNCDLRWLRGILEQRKILIPSVRDILCSEPPFVRGLPLFQLKFADLRCVKQGWAAWGSWSICNTHCGGGLRYRERKCENVVRSRFGCVGNKFQTENCNTHPCPLFQLMEWSTWAPCSRSCGDGISIRKRSCIDFFTGKDSLLCVEARNETRPCHITTCKIDGAWSQWSPWSPCSRTCGMSVKRRRRSCTDPIPQNGGAQCDGGFSQSQNQICIAAPCVSKMKWTSWSEFSPCSTSCGPGDRIRKRFCINEVHESVKGCTGNSTDVINCTFGACPIHGGWSSWSDWSRCHPIICKMARTRNCSQPEPAYGGRFCIGSVADYRQCAPKDCFLYSQWSNWGSWSECSKSCNGGYRTRHRKCLWGDLDVDTTDIDGAVKVSRSRSRNKRQMQITCGPQRTEVEDCNTVACLTGTETVWGSWSRWSTCKGGCNGKQIRKRTCMYPSIRGGLQYCEGHGREEKRCQARDCQSYRNETILGASDPCSGKGAPENGYEFIKKTGTTIIATYSCKRFYKLRGERRMTCDPRRGWDRLTRPLCVPICGKRTLPGSDRSRVFGGENVSRGSWPWQVLIVSYLQVEGGWRVRCGGSLINDQWIVTAGHCLFETLKDDRKRLIAPSGHKLYFGVHNKDKRDTDSFVQVRKAIKTIHHPKLNLGDLDNDIGLIKLDKKVQFSNYIKPVCLPNKWYRKFIATPGKQGHVIGWGLTRFGSPKVLQELTLPVVSKADCKKAHEGVNVTESMFCAGRNRSFFDTCKGDSGGGYLFWDRKRRKWTLQGVISWGGKTCGMAGMYSVYAKVGLFSKWIKRVIRRESRF